MCLSVQNCTVGTLCVKNMIGTRYSLVTCRCTLSCTILWSGMVRSVSLYWTQLHYIVHYTYLYCIFCTLYSQSTWCVLLRWSGRVRSARSSRSTTTRHISTLHSRWWVLPSLSICLSICVSIHLPTSINFYLSIYLWVLILCFSICLSNFVY